MKINNFVQAQEFLFQYIPHRSGTAFPGELGLERAKYFYELLGNPQNKLKVIHLAGTSGKGSTAYLTSYLLINLGFKTGLHLSPHLMDIRERFQINNQLISEAKFVEVLNQLILTIQKVEKSKHGSPTYFEILTAVAFVLFAKEKVDYAVIETGLGGLLDATNTIDRDDKLVILTQFGFDHTKILGKKLSQIAYQKSAIIQKNNFVISAYQHTNARKAIEKRANSMNSHLIYIQKNKNFSNIQITSKSTIFNIVIPAIRQLAEGIQLKTQTKSANWIPDPFDAQGKQFRDDKKKKMISHLPPPTPELKALELGLIGEHQVQNASLALTAVNYLSHLDNFEFNETKIREALKTTQFKGRFEIVEFRRKKLVIDGAHNPQKMQSLIKTLQSCFPDQKFDFLIAFKFGKDDQKMLRIIQPHAHRIYITQFLHSPHGLLHKPQNPAQIASTLQNLGYTQIEVFADPKAALDQAILDKNKILVITGSLYFVGDIYKLIDNRK